MSASVSCGVGTGVAVVVESTEFDQCAHWVREEERKRERARDAREREEKKKNQVVNLFRPRGKKRSLSEKKRDGSQTGPSNRLLVLRRNLVVRVSLFAATRQAAMRPVPAHRMIAEKKVRSSVSGQRDRPKKQQQPSVFPAWGRATNRRM